MKNSNKRKETRIKPCQRPYFCIIMRYLNIENGQLMFIYKLKK